MLGGLFVFGAVGWGGFALLLRVLLICLGGVNYSAFVVLRCYLCIVLCMLQFVLYYSRMVVVLFAVAWDC